MRPLELQRVKVTPQALVIGGGIAGMTSSLSLADQGFEVYLVEREKELGGKLRNLKFLITGEDPGEFFKQDNSSS